MDAGEIFSLDGGLSPSDHVNASGGSDHEEAPSSGFGIGSSSN